MKNKSDRAAVCLCTRCENQVARFELTIDIDSLLDEADSDHSGFIDFEVSTHFKL